MTKTHRPGLVGPLATEHQSLVRPGAVAHAHHPPDRSEPLVLDGRLGIGTAQLLLASERQALAFVTMPHGAVGVVTAEDLRFAHEWAGATAFVALAVTQVVVDVEPEGSDTRLHRATSTSPRTKIEGS